MHARFLGRHLYQEMKVKFEHCKLVVHLTTICVRKGQKVKRSKTSHYTAESESKTLLVSGC